MAGATFCLVREAGQDGVLQIAQEEWLMEIDINPTLNGIKIDIGMVIRGKQNHSDQRSAMLHLLGQIDSVLDLCADGHGKRILRNHERNGILLHLAQYLLGRDGRKDSIALSDQGFDQVSEGVGCIRRIKNDNRALARIHNNLLCSKNAKARPSVTAWAGTIC